jgi:hypothetical protein
MQLSAESRYAFNAVRTLKPFPGFWEPAGRAAGRANFGMDNRRRQEQSWKREKSRQNIFKRDLEFEKG